MKKRTIALLLSSFMLVTTLGGCTATKPAEAPAPAAESKVLKIAAFEGGYGKTYWNELITKFEAAHSGVKVELTAAKNLEEVIRPKIQGGDVPDLIYLAIGATGGLTETFIKEEGLSDLTNVLNKKVPGESVTVKEKILPGFLDTAATNPYGDGKTYLAPLFYSPTGLFYNEALIKSKGYSLPKTWDEMLALGEKAKADGISLWAYPTSGYLDSMIPAMLAAAGGIDAFNGAMNYKEGFWSAGAGQQTLETVGKLKAYLEPSVVGNANPQGFKQNQQLILDNKALFMPNGTWLPDEMKDAPRAEGFDWGFMAYPAFKAGGDAYSYNFFEQMYIPKDAKAKDLAEEFMAYMYSDEAVAIIAKEAKAVVPVKGAIEIASKILDPLQVEMFKVYENGAKPVMGGFVASAPVEGLKYADVYVGTVDSIMNGSKTVADWTKALTEASDKMRANIIK